MKALKFIGLLTLVAMSNSCGLINIDHEPKFTEYILILSFQDTSGNDLVKGIDLEEWSPSNAPMEEAQAGSVNSSLFKLDIILPEPCKDWDNEIYNTRARPGYIPAVLRPGFGYEKLDNDYYALQSTLSIPKDDCPTTKMLTYKMKCPYIFGDDTVHEFVTYWDIPKNKNARNVYGKCFRIEFEERVFTEINCNDELAKNVYRNIVTIPLLDKDNP